MCASASESNPIVQSIIPCCCITLCRIELNCLALRSIGRCCVVSPGGMKGGQYAQFKIRFYEARQHCVDMGVRDINHPTRLVDRTPHRLSTCCLLRTTLINYTNTVLYCVVLCCIWSLRGSDGSKLYDRIKLEKEKENSKLNRQQRKQDKMLFVAFYILLNLVRLRVIYFLWRMNVSCRIFHCLLSVFYYSVSLFLHFLYSAASTFDI